jgi:hypothetical protein
MAYIGKTPVIGNFVKLDAITVVNGQAAYTMQNGDVIDFVLVLGNSLDIGTPSDNTVTAAKLADSSVTSAKLSGALVTPSTLDVNGNELILDADGDTSITADTDDQIDVKIGGTDRIQFNSDGSIKFTNTPPIKSFDFGSCNVTIANGSYIDFASTSGVWILTETVGTGQTGVLASGGGSTTIIGQTGSIYSNSSSSGSVRFFNNSGTSSYRLQNNYGITLAFGICHISTRAST